MRIRLIATAWVSFVVCTAAAIPQRTWIVDFQNGPGTDFLDLPPAVAAASAGDIIQIRWGSYTAATIDKGVTVLGDPGRLATNLNGALRIQNIPATQRVVLKNIAVFGSTRTFVCSKNAGGVHFEHCDEFPNPFTQPPPTSLIEHCAVVTLSNSSWQGWEAIGSRVFLSDSRTSRCQTSTSVISFVRTTVQGVGGYAASCYGNYSPAIVASGDNTVLVGVGSEVRMGCYTGYYCGTICAPAIVAASAATVVFVDPGATVLGPVSGTVPSSRDIPGVTSSGALPGNPTRVDTHAPPGAAVALLVSLPTAAPITLPIGEVWIDPLLNVLLDIGVVPPSGIRTVQQQVSTAYPPGLPFLFQSAVVLPSAALVLAQPSVSVLWN